MSRHFSLLLSFSIALWSGMTALSCPPTFATESQQTDRTIGLSDVTQGSFLLTTAQPGRYLPAPTLTTDVRISVTGIIARTILRQEFVNPSRALGRHLAGGTAEGTFQEDRPDCDERRLWPHARFRT
jgi:hypothetical protein